MAFYHNELYVLCGLKVNNDTVNYIAKYTGQLGTGDIIKSHFNFNFFSNPVNSSLNLILSSPLINKGMLILTDAIGCEQLKAFIPKQTLHKEIDVAELSAGIYFLTLVTESGRVTMKFMKE